jgi:thiamine biosynthesis lipoprotein
MGVDARIILYAHTPDHATSAAAAAFDRLNQLNTICSDYLKSSELNNLSNAPPNTPHRVSDDLFHVLTIAEEVRAASNNSFDISLAPAITLWREARNTKCLPTREQLERALSLRAPILLDPHARTVTLPIPNMRLDLGGIAKGYAAHQAVLTLRAHHTPHCLVALAGDISVGEAPPHEQPHQQPNEPNGWRIAIDHATSNTPTDSSTPTRELFLANACVSTSGTNIQYIEINGVRYAHLIDPHTGLGSTTAAAITITGPEGAHTDALATALCIMNDAERAALLQRFPDYTLIP